MLGFPEGEGNHEEGTGRVNYCDDYCNAASSRHLSDVSVVFVRGRAQEAIESWVRQQSLDRRPYEVIVVSPGAVPSLPLAVTESLGKPGLGQV